MRERRRLVVPVLGRADEVRAEHPAGACDEDLHDAHRMAISALSPTTKRYARGSVGAARDRDVLADQARLDPAVQVLDRRALEHDRVLDLGVGDRPRRRRSPCTGRCRRRSGTAPRPMIAGPRTVVRSSRAPLSIATRPSTRESISSPSMRSSMSSRISRFASSMSCTWPVSFHQPRTMCGSTRSARVHQVLDRVGDLELAAAGRLDRARRVEDRRREHVDADEREVGLRLGRLLDQPRDPPVAVELRDAVVLGVGHRGQQDQRVGLARSGRSRPAR